LPDGGAVEVRAVAAAEVAVEPLAFLVDEFPVLAGDAGGVDDDVVAGVPP